MQEIANRVIATCYHDELHELLSRYKTQLPQSQLLLITNSALNEELECNLDLISNKKEG